MEQKYIHYILNFANESLFVEQKENDFSMKRITAATEKQDQR